MGASFIRVSARNHAETGSSNAERIQTWLSAAQVRLWAAIIENRGLKRLMSAVAKRRCLQGSIARGDGD
jgi:hypothetical protein